MPPKHLQRKINEKVQTCCKVFLDNNDSVKSAFQKWIIYHPHFIQSPIKNDYIKVKFDDVNGGVNTEFRHKVIIQVYICELRIDMIKEDTTGFYMAYDEK